MSSLLICFNLLVFKEMLTNVYEDSKLAKCHRSVSSTLFSGLLFPGTLRSVFAEKA